METTPWSPVRRRPINGRPNPTRTLKFSGLYEMNPYPSQKFARNKSVSVTCCVWFVDEIDHVYVFVKRNNSKAPEKLYPQKLLKPFNSETPHTTPVLLCTTKYYSRTTLYYKVLLQYYSVLLQYYSVLHSATPVLLCTTLCTTKYYSSTTLYYKVLLCTTKYYSSTTLQYYSVLQSTTPVLLCTTKNYSSTLLRYKVLLQYYSVLQSTTPVLLSWLIRVTYETLFTMRGTTEVLLQNHRLLRLPRKMTLMIDPHHIWNVSYNARSNRDVSPTSHTAPATKSNTHHWSSSHLKRYLQCAEQHVS